MISPRVVLFVFICTSIFSQPQKITKMQFPTNQNIYEAQLLELSDDTLSLIWSKHDTLFASKSLDKGITWEEPILLHVESNSNNILFDINSIVVNDSFTIITYANNDTRFITKFDKHLNTLLKYYELNGEQFSLISNLTMQQNDVLCFLISRADKIYLQKSYDFGDTWEDAELLVREAYYGNLLNLNDDEFELLYTVRDSQTNSYRIVKSKFEYENKTLIESQHIHPNDKRINKLKLFKSVNYELYIIYEIQNLPNHLMSNDLYFLASKDGGETWSTPEKLTNYQGVNTYPKLQSKGSLPYFTFNSHRYLENYITKGEIWYGVLGYSLDLETPPRFISVRDIPNTKPAGSDTSISATVVDDDSLITVKLIYETSDNNIDSVYLYDSGTHPDEKIGDSIYTGIFPGQKSFDNILAYFQAEDSYGNKRKSDSVNIAITDENATVSTIIDINKFNLPIENNGVISDVSGYPGGDDFEGNSILYSSGFYISGLDGNTPWASTLFSANTRSEDYQAGNVGDSENDPYNRIFKISSNDPPFSSSWDAWSIAVNNGADFYDGENDGKYDPVDKNNNGIWDTNEDRPPNIGDVYTWCVFNDGNPTFNGAEQKFIEIRQTIFASALSNNEATDHTIFLKYEIENKNPNGLDYDSVYFAIAGDPDIGAYYNDERVGCDTTLNAGYTYNDGPDDSEGFGDTPPALWLTILAGPHTYIEGETYIDNNGDGFDIKNDTILDTAKYNLGIYGGVNKFPGAKNLGMTNFFHQFRAGGAFDTPNNISEVRNQLIPGLDLLGNEINVCELIYGNGSELSNCAEIDPDFMYSGNPVTNEGWICKVKADTRMLIVTGPFTLKHGEPVSIIAAYVVGKGENNLNSIEVANGYVREINRIYDNNFSDLPVSVEKNEKQPESFYLSQNYPNPFNPTTSIQYNIPSFNVGIRQLTDDLSKEQNVKLTIYDILGREVATLVNKQQRPGIYKVEWNASRFSSGVYFYKLSVGNFIRTRKMILIK
jgi:hypothetical protein